MKGKGLGSDRQSIQNSKLFIQNHNLWFEQKIAIARVIFSNAIATVSSWKSLLFTDLFRPNSRRQTPNIDESFRRFMIELVV